MAGTVVLPAAGCTAHGANVPVRPGPVSLHWNVTPAWSASKVNVAFGEVDFAGGVEVIVVVGAVSGTAGDGVVVAASGASGCCTAAGERDTCPDGGSVGVGSPAGVPVGVALGVVDGEAPSVGEAEADALGA